MGVEEKFLGRFEYVAVVLFILIFLLMYVVQIPNPMTAIVPEIECCGI